VDTYHDWPLGPVGAKLDDRDLTLELQLYLSSSLTSVVGYFPLCQPGNTLALVLLAYKQ
jgi:hypothetical protein